MAIKALVEYGAAMFQQKKFRAAAQAYWKALLTPEVESRTDQVQYLIKALVKCQAHVSVLLEERNEEESDDQIIRSLSPAQVQSYHRYLHLLREASCGKSHTPQYAEKSCRSFVEGNQFTKAHKLPRFFSWVVPGYLAGLSIPRCREDILALESLGIVLLITVVEESPLPQEWFAGSKIRNVFYPVRNLRPPTVEEVDAFFKEVDEMGKLGETGGKPPSAAVHCGGGVGRAGTFLACYLVRHGSAVAKPFCEACKKIALRVNRAMKSADCTGECPNAEPPKMTAAEAIELLRVGRPGSLESKFQEDFVKKYTGVLWSRFSGPQEDDDDDFSGDALELLRVGKSLSRPSFVLLVGLPGSGKSWFASELLKSDQTRWVRICQDVLGSRDACSNAVSTYCRRNSARVILDRCNPTAAERKEWLELAFKPRDAVAVYFSAGSEICKRRISNRFGHETIRAGGGKNAVMDMAKRMEVPRLEEGFAAVYCVHSFENAASLVKEWSSTSESSKEKKIAFEIPGNLLEEASAAKPSVQKKASRQQKQTSSCSQSSNSEVAEGRIIKFPRTEHFFDPGGKSVSADDLVADTSKALEMMVMLKPGQSLHLEEKIDGSNMGFSLSSGDRRILTQNRSHFISCKEQKQYGILEEWIAMHRQRLIHLLGDEPGKRIVYGEWMVAQHSIHYTKLPDYFIAFDVLDVEEKRFYSRRRFNELLEEANRLELEEGMIYRVPEIVMGEPMMLQSKERWKSFLMDCKSAFREGPVEGIYIRLDEEEWLKVRMKLVRPDFVAGNENWSKFKINKNLLAGNIL